jgi:hypothetical protein
LPTLRRLDQELPSRAAWTGLPICGRSRAIGQSIAEWISEIETKRGPTRE